MRNWSLATSSSAPWSALFTLIEDGAIDNATGVIILLLLAKQLSNYAGYKEGRSAFSFYELSKTQEQPARRIISNHTNIIEGKQLFTENINTQTITHTLKDNPEIVNSSRLVEIADAIVELIHAIDE